MSVRLRSVWARPFALPLALFAGGLAISGVTILNGIQPNDEGLMLQAAARIAHGEVPYRDFWWFYPPGQSYLLGGLWALFGPSLLTWRIVRVLLDATVALLAWRLARRGGASPPVALGVWLVSALAMAYPTGPHPFPVTLALALGALLVFEKRPAWAGALVGVAAFWRIEFAGYLALGILIAYAVSVLTHPRAEALRLARRFAGAGVVVALVLYLPVLLVAGVSRSLDLLVRYPVVDFGDYQSLPFPLHYDGPLNTGSLGGFLSDSAENLLAYYLPLALVIGLVACLLALGLRFDRTQWPRVAVAVFALGMFHYLLARTDIFHTAPLTVLLAVLGAWVLGDRRAARAATPGGEALAPASPLRRARLPLAAGGATLLAAAALAYALVEGADRRWLDLRTDYAPLRLGVADGVRVPPAGRADLERAVSALRARVPEGAPTYVLPRRADLVTAGYPLLYVLADRENASRYDIAAPGVVTTAKVQREIVAALERTRAPALVRDTSPVTAAPEPNRAGVSTGVTLLDDYVARAYRVDARFGPFTILVRR